ncbi:MAG: serine/threonine-protein kinase [Gemmatimonadaceae bacterium]
MNPAEIPESPLAEQLQQSLGTAYAIDREIGGGGMSRVFLATETALGRRVVIKLLPPELAAGVSIERFKREIQLAARLQHAHIVPLLNAGVSNDLPYFTMPFVDGESLRVRLEKRGELPIAEAVRVLREIASALAYAHEQGIVHRDIKPDNVLLSGGAAMVTDFGVAKALSSSNSTDHGAMTSAGIALGTPAYMSPEQASADPIVDRRADVYAFGVLAYELLTGQTPFSGRTPQGMLAAHVTEPPEPIQKRRPSLPSGLSALVMRCLEKRPADRPQSANEVVSALDDLSTPSGGMLPTSAGYVQVNATAASPSRSSSLSVSAVVVVALLLVAGVFAWKRAGSTNGSTEIAPKSIAVLPLENVSGDTTMQFFADGMTDELTTAVARLPGLRVASRSATESALNTSKEVKALGARLSVNSVLDGRLRRSGNHLRLTATLTNVADGSILWTETYDREVKDVFQMQDDIAHAIASALQVSLGGTQKQFAERGTSNSDAHDLYLRARYLQSKYTEAEMKASLQLYANALAKDPKYAMAWAGIADTWINLADDFVAPHEAVPKIRDAIARGLAIDSTNPELRNSRASLAYFFDRDARKAEQLMTSAIRDNPALVDVGGAYAQVLWNLGLRDSARAYVTHQVDRDPTSPIKLIAAFTYFQSIGDGDRKRYYCTRIVELYPFPSCSAIAADYAGKTDSAIAILRPMLSSDNSRRSTNARYYMVLLLLKQNKLAEARALLVEFEALVNAAKRYQREDWLAVMWATVGDNDRAMYWYERALTSGSSGIGSLYYDIIGLGLRNDPRLIAFARRAGLPDPPPYWR